MPCAGPQGASAAAVTVRPRGFKHSSRAISPGWAGLWISISLLLTGDSVVIEEIDVGRVLTLDLRVTLAMDARFLARGNTNRQFPDTETAHCPS